MTIDKFTTIKVLKELQKARAIIDEYIENHGGDDGGVEFHESRKDEIFKAFEPINYVFTNTFI